MVLGVDVHGEIPLPSPLAVSARGPLKGVLTSRSSTSGMIVLPSDATEIEDKPMTDRLGPSKLCVYLSSLGASHAREPESYVTSILPL